MKITQTFLVALVFFMLTGCSTRNLMPSASNCYGDGQPGCEQYWGGEKPKLVTIEPVVDDNFIRKFNIPSKEKYINQGEVTPSKKWSKPGTSKLEKEKALLECGSGEYLDDKGYQFMKSKSLEEYNAGLIWIQRCMLNDGFRYVGKFTSCISNSSPSACHVAVPTRNFNTRINSKYCIANAHLDQCQPQPIDRILSSEKCQQYPLSYFCQPDWYSIDTCTRFPKSQDCQPEQKGGTETYVPMREFPEKSLKLQQDMQRDSNRQMNKLLRNTAPKTGR